MKILVAVKQVAALDEGFEIRGDGRGVDPDFLVRDLNEWDDYSIEEAVRMKEAAGGAIDVVAVTVAPEEADEALRKCLAKGADRAIRVWDDAVAGSDPVAIARVLAAVVRREAPQLVFAGAQSSDQAAGATGVAMAAFLGWPHAAVVTQLASAADGRSAVFRRELEGGVLHELSIRCPAVFTISSASTRRATPRCARSSRPPRSRSMYSGSPISSSALPTSASPARRHAYGACTCRRRAGPS